jgi:hypothetical protein
MSQHPRAQVLFSSWSEPMRKPTAFPGKDGGSMGAVLANAGASDYCSWPFEGRQIHWLMESAFANRKTLSVWTPSIGKGFFIRA